jgi:hypothetical protein
VVELVQVQVVELVAMEYFIFFTNRKQYDRMEIL